MKNKYIIIITITVFVALSLYGVISIFSKEESSDNLKNENLVNNITQNEKNAGNEIVNANENKQDDEKVEEKYDTIVPNSKIGTELFSNMKLTDITIFSDILYDEIDSNSLSNKAKITYAYLLAFSKDKYLDKIKVSENYQTGYILQEELESIVKDIFGKDTTITHQDILIGGVYKEADKLYLNVPMGFGGISMEYSFDIPYEIREYESRYEVNCYRLYLTANNSFYDSNVTMDERADENIVESDNLSQNKEEVNINESNKTLEGETVSIFSNRNRSNLILKTEDTEFLYNVAQSDLLYEKILDKSIETTNLKKVVYVLEKEDERYIIKSIK